jgi:parallel beta-helix repeat protein
MKKGKKKKVLDNSSQRKISKGMIVFLVSIIILIVVIVTFFAPIKKTLQGFIVLNENKISRGNLTAELNPEFNSSINSGTNNPSVPGENISRYLNPLKNTTKPALTGGSGGGGGGGDTTNLPINPPCVSNIINTTWTDWVSQENCRIDDKQLQSRTRIEYDLNNCRAINKTYLDFQNISCNYCSYNLVNITGNWVNISCLSSNTMNQSRTKTEYDANYNNCYALTLLTSDLWNFGNNKTYTEYRNTVNCQFSCVPTLICANYFGQCGINLFDGCSNVLNCANNCQGTRICYLGVCQEPCSNDTGCSSSGNFCDGTVPYACQLNSSSGCFYRINRTNCLDSCINGVCAGTIQISSCTDIDSSGTYLLTQDIINNSLTSACINIGSEKVVLDCQGNSISSLNPVTGIYSNQKNTTIKNCNISMGVDSPGFGIEIENTSGAIVQNNVLNKQYTGIYFHTNVTNSLIEGNEFVKNNNKAVHVSLSSENILRNNLFENNTFYGIILTKSFNNQIENNILKGNSLGVMWYGILIEASLDANPDGNNQIINNQILDSRTGVYVKTSNNIIKNNFINNSLQYHGLYIFGGNNSVIINNTLNNNKQFGLRIRNSNNNTIKNNTALFNIQQSLEISGTSSNNNIENNFFCSSVIKDISCEINQIFNSDYCDSGSVCGGVCVSCNSFSGFSIAGITGNVVSDSPLNKNNFFLVLGIFSIIIIGLVLIRKIRLARRNIKLVKN